MPSPRNIQRRIRSIKNTSQITKAMQMVASSKMRRAQQAAMAGRPYATLMNKVLGEVTAHAGDFSHPLMDPRRVNQRAVILISTDKGLCGALNGNLMRETAQYDSDTTVFITAGRKASQFIARTKRKLAAEFTYKDAPTFTEARAISKFVQDMFLKKEVDTVDVLYNRFLSTLSQKPQRLPLLPIGQIQAVQAGPQSEAQPQPFSTGATEFQFEPSAGAVLGGLLPHYLNFQIYQLLLEAKASEHSARMVAMKNATDNALQLIKDLTVEYNKIRQATITKELLEIASAQMSMG